MQDSTGSSSSPHRVDHALVVPRTPPAVLRPQHGAAQSANELSPRRVVDAIRYWWAWALPVGVCLSLAAAAAVYVWFVPQYQASAWLRIEEHTPYLAFESQEARDHSKGFVQTQIELLRSPMVLRPVAAEPDVLSIPDLPDRTSPSEWLRRAIEIKAVGTSELHTVSFTCSQPKAAARVVNAVLDSYFRLRAAEQGQRIERVVKILDLERDSRAQEVETLRRAVRDMAKEVTGHDPYQTTPEGPTAEKQGLSDLANRLIAAEVEETVLRARAQVLEGLPNQPPAAVSELETKHAVAAHPEVQQASAVLAEKQRWLSELQGKLTRGQDNPSYQRAQRELEHAKRTLEELTAVVREQVVEHLEGQRAGRFSEDVSSLKAELESKRVVREMLQERYEEELKEVRQAKGDTVTLKFRQEELARAEKVLDLISERIVKLKTEQGAPPRVWEMQRAEIPTSPLKPVPYLNMALASLVGLCAPFGIAVFKERLTARVSDAEFVERHSQIPVLGEITRLPSRSAIGGWLRPNEQLALGMFEESMDMLRSSLFVRSHAGPLRVIAVTSAVKEEGKTSVSTQLAVSIARATGQRVLIVDGDMRSPNLHAVFQVPLEPGLVDVLSGKSPIASAIATTATHLVDVLPAGLLKGNPHALLENGRWEKLLELFPAKYRHVIVDTPPVLAAGESLVLSRGADSVLLCALRDVTRVPQLRKAAERVSSAGAKVAGLVLNGVSSRHYVGRYGSYPYSRD